MWPHRSRGNHERAARLAMVQNQLERRGISDQRVLQAMREVPRHAFVPDRWRAKAYGDHPIPIAEQQTISQPYMVALMVEHLRLKGVERILEIGTGSGYQAAVLSRLAAEVYTLECFPSLAADARVVLQWLDCRNVRVVHADGCRGLAGWAPYHGIIVAAAAPLVPSPLQAQLADGGRLVMPVGGPDGQRLVIVTRQADTFSEETTVACRFVPLLGADAQ